MGSLTDLENVSQKETQACFFDEISEIKEILEMGCAATRGEYNGAINIWKDDSGKYRASVHRNLSTIDSIETPKIKAIESYVKTWIPKIQ